MNMHTHAHICVSFTDKKVVGLRKRPPAPLPKEKKGLKKCISKIVIDNAGAANIQRILN